MKKSIITILLFIVSVWGLKAQQDAQYTQYMYNTIAVNPAYAGSRGALSMTALHRSQWLGVDGAPTTQTFNFNTPISQRVGIGLSVVNDEIGNGTSQETLFDDFNKLRNYSNEVNSSGINNIDRKFSPNFGAGIYYHTDKFYTGLSVPNFLQTEHFENSNASFIARERMNIYLITGYVFDLNPNVKFKPAFLLKAVSGAPIQADFSANFMFKDKFTLGAAYRWDAALSALFGFQLSDSFMLGLAYDREITELGGTQFNDGSFEILLRYELTTKYKRILTPRFF